MDLKNEENCFTFVWRICNCRMNLKKDGEYMESPIFATKKFLNTKWLLRFYPKGEKDNDKGQLSCSLIYAYNSEGPREINIDYKIFLINNQLERPKFIPGKSVMFKKGYGFTISFKTEEESTFLKDDIYVLCYLSMDTVEMLNYTSNDSDVVKPLIPTCLKPDSLTQKCSSKIFQSVSKDLQKIRKQICYFPNECFGRSVISTESKSFSWLLADIINSPSSNQHSILLATISEIPDLLLSLFITELVILVDIQATDAVLFPIKAICKMSITDSSGKVRCFTESEHIFSPKENSDWSFQFQCNKTSELIDKDTCESRLKFLCCEIAFSKGTETSWIEKIPSLDFSRLNSTGSRSTISHSTFKNIYTSKLYCDINIQLQNKTVQAHKAVLCVHSPVFKAMFNNNMKENTTNTISIDDLEYGTIDRLLSYMYSGSLEDMDFVEAIKLYKASDKYQIMILREKCAQFIYANLTLENACQALCLADACQDKTLKAFVSHFIFQNVNEILNSDEWKLLSEENLKLANEILQTICLKLSQIQIN